MTKENRFNAYVLGAVLGIVGIIWLERLFWPDNDTDVVTSLFQVQETGDVLQVPDNYQPLFHTHQCFVHKNWKLHEPSPAGVIVGVLDNQVYIVMLESEANQHKHIKGGHYVLAWSFDQKYRVVSCPVIWQSTTGKKPQHGVLNDGPY